MVYTPKSRIKSDKRGFTLVELLVTLTLLLLVLTLTYQLSSSFYRQYTRIEQRWWVQTVSRRVMEYFQQNSEPLSNSSSMDLFYSTDTTEVSYTDEEIESGIMKGVPTAANDKYAYIYTKPSPDGVGSIIWVLDRWQQQDLDGDGINDIAQPQPRDLAKTVLGITSESFNVPLDMTFNIAVAPVAVDLVDENYVYSGGQDRYLSTTVDVVISSGSVMAGSYSLSCSFTLNNMMDNKQVNFTGSTPTQTAGNCFIAGWTDASLACPVDTATYPHAKDDANVLRYISAMSFLNSQNTNADDIDLEGAGLCFGSLAMSGSDMEMQTLGALRDFRDNVLAGTAIGDKIIYNYYNVWSPALLHMAIEHPSLLKVGKALLVPASFLAYFVSE